MSTFFIAKLHFSQANIEKNLNLKIFRFRNVKLLLYHIKDTFIGIIGLVQVWLVDTTGIKNVLTITGMYIITSRGMINTVVTDIVTQVPG